MIDDITEMYHYQYQIDSQSEQALAASRAISHEIVEMFHPKTAIDVGCGGGALIRGFLNEGVDCWGIEGSVHAVNILPERIKLFDLREPLPLKPIPQHDIVTCFDVGEHIETRFHCQLVRTIYYLTAHNGFTIFGAAGEGQDGLGHVACKHPCYWIDLFQMAGFSLMPNKSEYLRYCIKSQEDHNFLWWIARNLMVFRRLD